MNPLERLARGLSRAVSNPPRPVDIVATVQGEVSRVIPPVHRGRGVPRRTYVIVTADQAKVRVSVQGPASPRYLADLRRAAEGRAVRQAALDAAKARLA